MITGNELNADLTAHVVVKAEDLAWRETEHPGVFLKEFERITDPGKARETWMVRLDAGIDKREDKTVLFSNPAAATMLCTTPDALVGKPFDVPGPMNANAASSQSSTPCRTSVPVC